MATLHVRKVPEELYERLRSHARQKGNSLNKEVIEILKNSEELNRKMTLREMLDESNKLRTKNKMPVEAPSTVDLIRKDRDSH